MYDIFEVTQLEEWMSNLIQRAHKVRKQGSTPALPTDKVTARSMLSRSTAVVARGRNRQRDNSVINITPSGDIKAYYLYTSFLNWILHTQKQLRENSELANLHLLRDQINTQPWSCSADDPEHQHREIGIALILALELRQQYPNFMGIGGWVPSSHEPLGVSRDLADSSRWTTRDLAVGEIIEGVNLRQAITKFKLTYRATLQILVQLAAVLFEGWKHLRLQLGHIDRDTVMIRRLDVKGKSIHFGDYKVRVSTIVTITDYHMASVSYNNVDYGVPGDTVEMTSLLRDLLPLVIPTSSTHRALDAVYSYLNTHSTYTASWLDGFMTYGLATWKG